MTYTDYRYTVSEKLFIYQNLRRRTNFQCTLLYLNSEGIFENFEQLIISIFLDIYIKIGQKEPLVERNGSLKEFYMQQESATTYYTNGYS